MHVCVLAHGYHSMQVGGQKTAFGHWNYLFTVGVEKQIQMSMSHSKCFYLLNYATG